jgi:hypothetical protein
MYFRRTVFIAVTAKPQNKKLKIGVSLFFSLVVLSLACNNLAESRSKFSIIQTKQERCSTKQSFVA